MQNQKGFSLLAIILIVVGLIVVVGGGVLAYQYYNSNPNPNPNPVACTPNWTCDWGECINGYQSQVAKDLNNCGQPSSTAQTACTALAKVCGDATQPSLNVSVSSGATLVGSAVYVSVNGGTPIKSNGPQTSLNPGDTFAVTAGQVVGYTANLTGTCALGAPGAQVGQNYSCSIAYASSSTQPSIRVTSPNGGEVWTAKSIQTIWWSGVNKTVDLYLNPEPPACVYSIPACSLPTHAPYVLDRNIFSQNSVYTWIVATDIINLDIPAGQYRMKICTAGSQTDCDVSNNYFTIVASTTQPSITVTSPNGGESFYAGQQITLRWNSSNCNHSMGATLLGQNNSQFFLGNWVACNLGSQIVTIPSTVQPGNYKINISSPPESSGPEDTSDNYFTITSGYSAQPSITVTSPNGGETLRIGQTYNITWDAQNISQVFNIGLQTSDSSNFSGDTTQNREILMSTVFAQNNSTHIGSHTVIQNLGSTTRSFSWTIPTDFSYGRYNKIIITGTPVGCENGGCGGPELDWSNNSFTIVAP